MIRICVAFLLSINLLACATQQLNWHRSELEEQRRPPKYIDGYVDGCESGYHAAEVPYHFFNRDPKRFKSDRLYSDGWNDGFKYCKKEHESVESTREMISY